MVKVHVWLFNVLSTTEKVNSNRGSVKISTIVLPFLWYINMHEQAKEYQQRDSGSRDDSK